jgi:putative DNA methylase
VAQKRKLIEVSLPLETINRESAREKSIRHGHPSTLHLWWSRKPLSTARAVLFAQLVDDPSSHPEEFPTEVAQRAERERLHKLIEDLVVWENVRDERLFSRAHAEILKSTGGNPPPILDPFAGGGTIPLEAQRLGMEAHASDLNPVAVLINKALIEIPPRFSDQPPVFPGLADTRTSWSGAEGLAADVRAYGEWMRDEAFTRIGHLYPPAILPEGTEAPVIAWIWARTVRCPNPGCGIEMPLTSKWWLGKKRGKEAYVVPRVVADAGDPSGKRVEFAIGHDPSGPAIDGSMASRQGGTCVACDSVVDKDHIKREGLSGRMGAALMAVVAEGQRQRVYLAPSDEHRLAADVDRPSDVPDQELGFDPRNLWTPAYGLIRFSDLFTNRQLVALTIFSDLVGEARERVLADATMASPSSASNYADAVATYLGLGVSRMTDIANALCRWENTKEQVRNLFGRQAIPMLWDYAETAPFGRAAGAYLVSLTSMTKAIHLAGSGLSDVRQTDALDAAGKRLLISTDPPYYDNIGYSDLSDFFYVWLRRTLRDIYPDLLGTMLVPKAAELVANPYRHGGRDGARSFFEDGFRQVFARARHSALDDFPITVYYAFKQSETDDAGETSTGWETLLEGMIRSGWAITATWPMRSELSNRMLARDTNALASSIVLALRPRPDDAPTTDRRGFIAELQSELPDALRHLQQGGITPVDLPQAAIGPGMAVFSRYARVVEADGSPMTVHSALARVSEIRDQVLNEQEGDFDPATRFAIAWYRLHGYATGPYGDAEQLVVGYNTSVAAMDRDQILVSRAGRVTLIRPADTPVGYDVAADEHASAWEVLHHLIRLLETDGLAAAGELLAKASARPDGPVDPDLVKELAFLLFSIAEKNSWTADALAFNTLATAWSDTVAAARDVPAAPRPSQGAFDFAGEG